MCYVTVLTNITVAINQYRNGIMVCIHIVTIRTCTTCIIDTVQDNYVYNVNS